jgi:hypothetical protein
MVFIYDLLEGEKNRVEAHAHFDRFKGIFLKFLDEVFFIKLVKGIDDLVGTPYHPIYRIYRLTEALVQSLDTQRERCAIGMGDILTALS